jgi:anti-sigma regulatory factor (Ser/Thr protein kinase)/ActR/RegA family two-component response regulator
MPVIPFPKHPFIDPAPGKNSVLVVADDEINHPLFNQMTLRGWEVEYVADNRGALAVLKERPFDLIITAEKTKAKKDLELLRAIRTVRPHCRMIILTSDSTSEDAILALRERAFSLFSKPYSPEALNEIVRSAVEGPCWDDGIEVISAKPDWVCLFARCDQSTAERLLQFFNELVDLPEQEKSDVAYAFREMLMNAIRYGAKFDPNEYVEISYVRGRHMVACRVKDPGTGFQLNELYHSAISNPPDHPIRHALYREAIGLPPGGYGILLSRHLVDELVYNETGNEVLLVKYLERSSPPDGA